MVGSTASADSIRKLKTYNIIFVKSVALESVDNNCSLFECFKVSKAEVNFLAILCLSRNKTELLKTRKWSKDVSHLTFGTICRKTLNIDGL